MSKKILLSSFFILFTNTHPLQSSTGELLEQADHHKNQNVIVFTDGEVDDMASQLLIAHYVKMGRISDLLIVTSGFETSITADMIRKLYASENITSVSVYPGESIEEKACTEIRAVASALVYKDKERLSTLFDELELCSRKDSPANKKPDTYYSAVKKFLTQHKDVEILVLSAPTDLIRVLDDHHNLIPHIKNIYMTGGWRELPENAFISTFNWNVDIAATAKMFTLNLPIILYSTHEVTKFMPSFNKDSHSEFFEALSAKVNASTHFIKAHMSSWNAHTVTHYPVLKDKIAPYINSQMCSTDIIATISLLNEDFIEDSSFVHISVPDTTHLYIDNHGIKQQGFSLEIDFPSDKSKESVKLVTRINHAIFNREILNILN